MQGHKDKENSLLVHNSANLMQTLIKLIASLALANMFKIWSHDITQAFVEYAEKLLKNIRATCIRATTVFTWAFRAYQTPLWTSWPTWLLDQNSGRSLRTRLKNVQSQKEKNALYFKPSNGDLIGLIVQYVDDSFQAVTGVFRNTTDRTLETFTRQERYLGNSKISEINMSLGQNRILLDQKH